MWEPRRRVTGIAILYLLKFPDLIGHKIKVFGSERFDAMESLGLESSRDPTKTGLAQWNQ
jgi:hypothetical protein